MANSESASGRTSALVIASAFILAPTQIWSLVDLSEKGVTPAYVGAALCILWAFASGRILPPVVRLAVGGVFALSIWGLLLTHLQFPELAERAWKHWVLVVFSCLALYAGAATKLEWNAWRRLLPFVVVAYAVVIVYGLYQAFARRNGWPYAYLEVSNPGLSAPDGRQPGALSPNTLIYDSRASSLFVEPTVFGTYIAYGLGLSLAAIERGSGSGAWGKLGLVLSAAGLAACQSLSSVFAVGVLVLAYMASGLLSGRVQSVVRLGVAAVVAFGCLALMPGSLDAVAVRVGDFGMTNSSDRFDSTPLVAAALAARPWGLGLAAHVTVGDIQNGMAILLLDLGAVGVLVPGVLLWGAAIAWMRALRCRRSGIVEEGSIYSWAYLTLLAHFCVLGVYGTLYEPFYWVFSGAALTVAFRGWRLGQHTVRWGSVRTESPA